MLKNLMKKKQQPAKAAEEAAPSNVEQEFLLELEDGTTIKLNPYLKGGEKEDAEVKLLVAERAEIKEVDPEGSTTLAKKNLQKIVDRIKAIEEPSGPVIGDLLNQEQKKPTEKKASTGKGLDLFALEDQEAIVTIFGATTRNDSFGYCKVQKAIVNGETVNVTVMVHRDNMKSAIADQLVEGAIVKGDLKFHEKKSTKTTACYNLINVSVVQIPENGQTKMDIVNDWLKANTVVATIDMKKATFREILDVVKSCPKDEVEARLEAAYPNGFAVVEGVGDKRIYYAEA